MRRAVEHLAELGHQTVTYVAGPEASWADGMRWVALMEAAHELDLRVRRVGPCNVPTVHAGFDTAQEVLAQKPTAVIAYNDVMAIGVIKGMRRAGVRVPDDVSVIGFDNVVAGRRSSTPELTTVAAPLRAMGITGVKNLIAAIGGATPSREPIVLPVKLVVRGSTAQRRRKSTSPALGTTNVPGSASKGADVDGGRVEVAEVRLAAYLLRYAGRQGDLYPQPLLAGLRVVGARPAQVGRVGEHAPVHVREPVPLLHEVVAAVVPDLHDLRVHLGDLVMCGA